MCRYVSYLGQPLPLAELVYSPSNSLIHQAAEAMESPTRINADGFGVGWYADDLRPEPAVFKDVSPAWNNANLRSLADKVASGCIFAHVRAARRNDLVSRANCHPFQVGRILWMHNGDIPGRGRLHRRVCREISDDLAARIAGSTDSELAFMLFLSILGETNHVRPGREAMADAMQLTIRTIVDWWHVDSEPGSIVLNFCVSDGASIVATRFALGGEEAPTLHYCAGGKFICEGGVCRMADPDGESRSVIVSSEVITEDGEWREVGEGHLLTVSERREIELRSLDVWGRD